MFECPTCVCSYGVVYASTRVTSRSLKNKRSWGTTKSGGHSKGPISDQLMLTLKNSDLKSSNNAGLSIMSSQGMSRNALLLSVHLLIDKRSFNMPCQEHRGHKNEISFQKEKSITCAGPRPTHREASSCDHKYRVCKISKDHISRTREDEVISRK